MNAKPSIPYLAEVADRVRQSTGITLAVVVQDTANATDVLRFTEFADEVSARVEYDRTRRTTERTFLAVHGTVFVTTAASPSIEVALPLVSAEDSKTWKFGVVGDSTLPKPPIRYTPPAPRPKPKPVAPAQIVLRAQPQPGRWLAVRKFFDLA